MSGCGWRWDLSTGLMLSGIGGSRVILVDGEMGQGHVLIRLLGEG